MWAESEMLDGLTRVLWSTQQDSVGTSWGSESKLVQGQNLTTSLLNSGSGGRGESQSGNGHLWDLEQTVVIGDSADNNNGLSGVGFL